MSDYGWQSSGVTPVQEGWYLASWSLPCKSFLRAKLTGYVLVYFAPAAHWEDQYGGAIDKPDFWLKIPAIKSPCNK